MNGTHVCKLPKDVWCVSVCWCVWGVWLCVWCESLWLWSVSQWHDSHMYVWCVRVRVWRVSMRMCIVCVCVMSESEYVWCVSRSVSLWLWCASQCGVCECVGYVSVCVVYTCVWCVVVVVLCMMYKSLCVESICRFFVLAPTSIIFALAIEIIWCRLKMTWSGWKSTLLVFFETYV